MEKSTLLSSIVLGGKLIIGFPSSKVPRQMQEIDVI